MIKTSAREYAIKVGVSESHARRLLRKICTREYKTRIKSLGFNRSNTRVITMFELEGDV